MLILTIYAELSTRAWAPVVPIVIVWIIFPVTDFVVGMIPVRRLLTKSEKIELEKRWSFRLVVLSWAPLQIGFLLWACFRATDPSITNLRFLALAANTGLIAAEGINVAHELLHKRSAFEVFVGEFLLVCVCYGHFVIEHALGHHKNVATPNDPATMRFGESFYNFLSRTIVGGFRSAWSIECKRLRASGKFVWGVSNRVLRYITTSATIVIMLATLIGPAAAPFFLIQSVVAVTLLEQVNAIEHYGLVRKRDKSGVYEPVGAQHSWDAQHRFSNFLLFKLQNHADHHLRK